MAAKAATTGAIVFESDRRRQSNSEQMLRIFPRFRHLEVRRSEQVFNRSGSKFVTVFGMNSLALLKLDLIGRPARVSRNMNALSNDRLKVHLDSRLRWIPTNPMTKFVQHE